MAYYECNGGNDIHTVLIQSGSKLNAYYYYTYIYFDNICFATLFTNGNYNIPLTYTFKNGVMVV